MVGNYTVPILQLDIPSGADTGAARDADLAGGAGGIEPGGGNTATDASMTGDNKSKRTDDDTNGEGNSGEAFQKLQRQNEDPLL